MKATGIVRRIDDLGRVVIPKEIRRTLRIREGDPLEIFVDRGGEVILKKYSPIGELGDFAKEYVDSLHESTGRITLITDRDTVIAVAGGLARDFIDKGLTAAAEKIMDERRHELVEDTSKAKGGQEGTELIENVSFISQVIVPIIAEGDPIGSVIIASIDEGTKVGELELKLAETAAGFLAKQMEQ